MIRNRSALTLAGICLAMLLPSIPAHAQDGWLAQELTRLSALPHTLQAVSSNAWLQIPVRDQRIHNVSDDAYRNVRPQLDALASTARTELEHELDGILSGLRFDDLRITSSRQPLVYCGWINATRADGMLPASSDLQAILFTQCRTMAIGAVTKLVSQHADTLDLTLPALPHVDIDFPRWILADLTLPDITGTAALDPIGLQNAYQDRLARRIALVTPTLRANLDRVYAARTWQHGSIESPQSDCYKQLGALAAGNLGAYCRDTANRWIIAQLSAMTVALPTALTSALAVKPALDEDNLCHAVLSTWLPDNLPDAIHDAARSACLPEATRIIAQVAVDRALAITTAIDIRVSQLAAPILALPRTYDSLLTQGWFAQPATSWAGITPPSDPDVLSVRDRAQAEYQRRISPASDAALSNAREQINSAYLQAAGSESVGRQIRHLCGEDGHGVGLPLAPASSIRDQVVAVCVKAFETFKLARIRIALERAGLGPNDMTSLIVEADGRVRLPLRDFVSRAAAAGLQVSRARGVLGTGGKLTITPMGAKTPTLSGSVSRAEGGLFLDSIDPLPDWPSNTLETVLCLVADKDDLLNAQISAVVTMFAAFFASDADRPRTASYLMRDGLSQMQDARNRRACFAARQAFIDQAP